MEDKKKMALKALQEADIPYEIVEHPAVYTIEEMDLLDISFDQGEIVKNLFLRDEKGRRHFLVVLGKDKKVNLKELKAKLATSNLGFASEERLQKYLNLEKGSVTPLGVFYDSENAVEVIFDEDLCQLKMIGVHPNVNTATVWITYQGLLQFMERYHHEIKQIHI